MTAADPRDGLHQARELLAVAYEAKGPIWLPTAGNVRRGDYDDTPAIAALIVALAHARSEAVNEAAALEVLLDALSEEHGGEHHEDGCDVCRAIATLTQERAP